MGLIAWFRKERRWRRDHIAAFLAVSHKHSDGLTIFQHEAMSAVASFVPPENFKRLAMKDGSSEYLVAPLGAKGADLLIYENEAAIFGAKPYAWFEEWDYRTPAELLEELSKECAARAA